MNDNQETYKKQVEGANDLATSLWLSLSKLEEK